MLVILTTHPIQYQVPLWQALAKDGRVPFEVWYLTDHGVAVTRDREFGRAFAWDLDLLAGYRYEFLPRQAGATPQSFWRCRLNPNFEEMLRSKGAEVVWVQGWQVPAYWQAVFTAKNAGIETWLRGESHDLIRRPWWKHGIRRVVLSKFFARIDHFLYIGAANRRLYESYNIEPSRLHPAFYSVDNDRFASQAEALRAKRVELRRKWNIPNDAFCLLFCGKFIPRKRPQDVVAAASHLLKGSKVSNIHLLFVGSGELDSALRSSCQTSSISYERNDPLPPASFAGFLNQTEISEAYVAADCLVLPSTSETWGLVVNEAMAASLPCILSDGCGSAEDLGRVPSNRIFRTGDPQDLARKIVEIADDTNKSRNNLLPPAFSFSSTVSTVVAVYEKNHKTLKQNEQAY